MQFVKAVELALYNDPMNLSPLKQGDGSTFVVKVPRSLHPTFDQGPVPADVETRVDNSTRQKLAKSASDAAESARISIRSVRQAGQKASKSDVNANRITAADHRKDGIALDDEARRWSKEVDGIEEKAKAILLDR